MKRLTHLFFYTLASIAFLNVFSHSFPSLPALYACMTIFSLLFGVSFLTASGMPSAWTSRKVSSAVWDHWKKILGALFLLNGALCPTGFLLWFFLRFDQDLICYENLPPEGRNDPARPEGRLKDSISCWFRRNRAGHQVPSPVLSGVSGNHVFFCPY